jgi:hypothetical protein
MKQSTADVEGLTLCQEADTERVDLTDLCSVDDRREERRELLCGSGVLCYAICSRNRVKVLLGRERETVGWHLGSGKWSTFSGRTEVNESAIQSAAREFVEESCAAVALDVCDSLPMRREVAEARLEGQPSLTRSFESRGVAYKHITLLRAIPFAGGRHPILFSDFRRRLVKLDNALHSYTGARRACSELPRFLLPGSSLSETLVTLSSDVIGDTDCVDVTVLDTSSDERHVVRVRVSSSEARLLSHLGGELANLRTYLASRGADTILQHPAVTVRTVGGVVVDVSVDRSFLEKSEIRWFDVSELRTALHNQGCASSFRRCFLESIPLLLQKLEILVSFSAGRVVPPPLSQIASPQSSPRPNSPTPTDVCELFEDDAQLIVGCA